MGKKGSWFAAVRNIFKLNSKDSAKVKAFAVQFNEDKETNEVVANSKIKRSKDKGRWSFGKSKRVENPEEVQKPISFERRISTTGDNDQDKHALAVAAASAAAAEAAVAAAFAAAEVVRLTGGPQSPSLANLNRHLMGEAQHSSSINLKREDWAAIKIQTAFRGYLARRALRALRGLVRLQALVRGHAVRRQATRTFQCMQALVRVQARIRAMHSKMSEDGQGLQWQPLQKNIKEWQDQRKGELGDPELEIWDDTVQSVEEKVARRLNKKEAALKRERALAYAVSHQSSRLSPQQASCLCTDHESDQLHWGCNWLERWMAARSWEGLHFDSYASELNANQMKLNPPPAVLGTPKKSIMNAPTPKGGSVKAVVEQSAAGCVQMTMTPERQSCVMASCNAEEGSVLSTGGSVLSACSFGHKFGSTRNGKAGSSIADDDSVLSPPRVPNYMTSTHSAKAKARSRSLSTPKQRTVTPEREHSLPSSVRKRLSFPTAEGSVGSARSTPKHPRAFGLTERSPSLKCFPVSNVEAERYITSYA